MQEKQCQLDRGTIEELGGLRGPDPWNEASMSELGNRAWRKEGGIKPMCEPDSWGAEGMMAEVRSAEPGPLSDRPSEHTGRAPTSAQ